jgi:hypothetical protein
VGRELNADGEHPTQEATIGGTECTDLSLEYEAAEDAESSSVTVSVNDLSGTSAFTVTGFPAGSHQKQKFAHAVPGAKVKLEVSGSTGRLRWLEYT